VFTTALKLRVKELREIVGLTKSTFKLYADRYPQLVVDMLTSPVKSAKSVIMKSLGISELEYALALKKLQKQTNQKSGPLFRGGFPFLISYLRTELALSDSDLRHVFFYYPVLFTISESYVFKRILFLKSHIG